MKISVWCYASLACFVIVGCGAITKSKSSNASADDQSNDPSTSTSVTGNTGLSTSTSTENSPTPVPSSYANWDSVNTGGLLSLGDTDMNATWVGGKLFTFDNPVGTASGNVCSVFDPALNSFKACSTTGMPSPRSGASLFAAGSQVVVVGGETSSSVLDGAIYDLANDKWAPIPQAPCSFSEGDHHAAVIGTKVYVVTATCNPAVFDTVALTWSSLPLTNYTATSDPNIYSLQTGFLILEKDGVSAQYFDLATSTWQKAPLPSTNYGPGATGYLDSMAGSLGNDLYMVLNDHVANALHGYKYNASANTWDTPAADSQIPTDFNFGFASYPFSSSHALIFTGYSRLYLFDPSASTWSTFDSGTFPLPATDSENTRVYYDVVSGLFTRIANRFYRYKGDQSALK